ncbi:MAG: hypothetical protein WCG25_05080 [bacterium]
MCRGSIEARLSYIFLVVSALKGNMQSVKSNTKNLLLLIKKMF